MSESKDHSRAHSPRPDTLSAQGHPTERASSRSEEAAYGDDRIHAVHQQLMREKEEPTEGFSPIPIFLLFMFGALMFWGGIYLSNYSGGFRADVFDPNYVPGRAEEGEVAAFDPMVRGERLYRTTCMACHQGDGRGVAGVFPPLSGSRWVTGSEERVALILLHGMDGPVEVLGNSYNGNMPAVGNWSDRDIHAVLTFIRQSFGNNASEVTEETVAQTRAAHAGRSASWSATELLDLFPME